MGKGGQHHAPASKPAGNGSYKQIHIGNPQYDNTDAGEYVRNGI